MIQTLSLFRPLNAHLLELLGGLTPADWDRPTVARKWTVKDVAAHLLDGNIRAISTYRDQVEIRLETKIDGYLQLVEYLNNLNAEWVKAMKRVSPKILLQWLEDTHDGYIQCLEALDLLAPARFSVAWAGDEVSPNWFHIAREYTEKWHHQQQIRQAVGRPGLFTREFYHPALATFFRALPHQYRNAQANTGTRILIEVTPKVVGHGV